MTRSPAADVLARWGYRVTTRGGWVFAAGHGAWHRWHGWATVPALPDTPWRFQAAWTIAGRQARATLTLHTPLGDGAWTTTVTVPRRRLVPTLAHLATAAAAAFGADLVEITALSAALRPWLPLAWTLRVDPTLPTPAAPVEPASPPVPLFDADRLEPRDATHLVAHGTHDYLVDLVRRTCTCPAFRFGRRPCKHLRAALDHAS